MPRRLLVLSLIASLICTSCSNSKDDVTPETAAGCSQYVAGDVLVGVKASVGIRTVFDWINSTGLRLHQVNGFTYISSLPADSLAYVKRTLLAKPYLNARGFTAGNEYVDATDHKIRVVDFLFDMTPQNQADWLQTMDALRLVDEGGARCQSCKDIYLKVPVGSEKYWVQTLAQHPAARWAELNCLFQVSLH
jgi:hypothetical protein